MEQPVGYITLDDFLEWEKNQEIKHELLHGRIIAFSGVSFDHNRIGYNVQSNLNNRLASPCFAYDSDVIVETIVKKGDNGLRADVVVSCSEDDAGKGRYLKYPSIIVEVRSPSNVGKEWEEKLFEYRDTSSIAQIVIIESDTRSVASYCRNEHGSWQPAISTIGNGTLRFPGVEIEMSLDEVYRRSTLDSE